jgi:hypothetical protein
MHAVPKRWLTYRLSFYASPLWCLARVRRRLYFVVADFIGVRFKEVLTQGYERVLQFLLHSANSVYVV